MTTRTKAEINREIGYLESIEVHVETNQGTYGTGDPMFLNREVYETVGGVRRERGPSAEDAPGRMRQINREELADLRKKVAALRDELKRAKN